MIVFAEAPADREVAIGRPLVGPTGQLWQRWLESVGIDRRDLWIDNIHPYQAPRNKIEFVDKATRAMWADDAETRVAALDDPWLLVPMGGYALSAFFKGEGSITKWRGSILTYVDRRGRQIKMIPVLHPAAVFRQPYWEKRCRLDWQRIADESKSREIRLPTRTHTIDPTVGDCRDFLADVRRHATDLAIDIETPRERIVTPPALAWACETCDARGVSVDTTPLEVLRWKAPTRKTARKTILHTNAAGDLCGPVESDAFTASLKPKVIRDNVRLGPARVTMVGFADSAARSFTIPTTLSYWRERSLLEKAWGVIRDLCETDVEKRLQNGLFDAFYLRLDHGIDLRRWTWDTLALHHALDPVEDHDLAFMASVFTREPYWKDDIKAGLEDLGEGAEADRHYDPAVFATYNGKDCCVTYEIADVLIAEHRRRGTLDRYHAHYASLFRPLLDMMVRGVRFDRARAAIVRTALLDRCARVQAELTEVAKVDLFGKSGALSPQKVKTYLYSTLKLPPQYVVNPQTKVKEITTREIAIRTLAVRFPDRVGPQATMILTHRESQKRASFFDDEIVDPDDRVRCSYRFTTEQMRLSSAKNPKRTGLNLQNQPNVAEEDAHESPRNAYRPDPGHVWLKIDGSQIESRIFDVLTKHPDHIERARAAPWAFDQHSFNASIIFGREITKADKLERRIGKTTSHMVQGGAGAAKLADVLMLQGIVRTVGQCQGYIDRLLRGAPGIPIRWSDVRRRLLREHKLVNAWGDEWVVTYERLNDDLFRRGYRFDPQSNAARWTNNLGMVPIYHYIKARGLAARLLLQVHDELDFSVAPADAWELWTVAKRSLERPVMYEGIELSVPAELSVGPSWGETVEFKRPPSREQFMSTIEGIVAQQKAVA